MPQCRRLLLAALMILQPACGGSWRAVTLDPANAVPPRQYVELWIAGHRHPLHRVVVHADSISGIPYLKSSDCVECRIAFPRATIDSIRLGNPEARLVRGIGYGFAALLVTAVILCSRSGDCTAD